MSQTLNTLCIGKVLLNVPQCASTNDYLKTLTAKNKPIDGTVVISDNQTAGRGQIGNKWQSEPDKNLTFSVYLEPKFLKVQDHFTLAKLASVSIWETLAPYSPGNFTIKWPNDIYYKDLKIGGILIENQIQGNAIQQSIMGIGLNINQEVFDDLPRAISLKQIVGKEVSKETILNHILEMMDGYYIKMRIDHTLVLRTTYHANLYAAFEPRNFKIPGGYVFGRFVGVNDRGEMMLHHEEDGLQYHKFKEIEWIFD